MAKPMLYLFMGYPGAGKTTVARLIEAKTGAVHIWSDQERRQMFGMEAQHTPEESQALYARLNKVVEQLLSRGQSVIYDTNFNYRSDRAHMHEMADRHGADVVTVWLTTPKELAKKRATEDSHGNHTRVWGNMSPEVFDRMSNRLEVPDESEKVIKIDGTDIDDAELGRILGW